MATFDAFSKGLCIENSMGAAPDPVSNEENARYPLGTVCWAYDSTGYKNRYCYVKYDETAGAIVAKSVLRVMNLAAGLTSLTTQFSVELSDTGTAGLGAAAGVALGTATDGYYGWILTRGVTTILMDSGSPVANDTAFVLSTNAGKGLIATASHIGPAFATASKDGTTVTEIQAFVYCNII